MTRSISVDAGKFDTKAMIARADDTAVSLCFRTKMSEARDTDASLPLDSHFVEYEGKTYVVGSAASDRSIDYGTSKMTELHKVCTYAAIALLIDNGDVVNLAIGCPISIFLNKTAKLKYRDFIAPVGKQVSITVDGIEKHFAFKKVVVQSESSGLVMAHADEYQNRTVGVIDIGGLNANCSVFERLIPLQENSFTTEMGSNKLMISARQAMETEFATSGLQDFILNDLQRNGYLAGKYKERSREIFAELKKDHIVKILDECTKNSWNLDFMTLIFTGGSSVFLKSEIEEVAVKERGLDVDLNLIKEDSNFSNAEGFLQILLKLTGKKI